MNFRDRAHRAFVAGVVVTTAHAVDDSFLQPQPGTAAGDHLSAGLIAVAAAALSLWAFPRVRPGLGALIALVWSEIALVSGAEALYYAQHGGLSGDDYSGLIAPGAEKLWAGTVVIHPDAKTGAHHHGPVESVIYVVSGRARMRWGERLEFTA